MKIVIIGAGPIGCYAGYLLAKTNHNVEIYEEHKEIGLPIQCTGLLTNDFNQFNLQMESFLVNTFNEIEVNSPNNKFRFKQKEYLIDRHKFDNYLAELARNAGARIYTQHSFVAKKDNKLIIKDLKSETEKEINADIIIAVDGPLSKTARAFGFYNQSRKNYLGMQAVVEGQFNPKSYQTFFSNEVCPELFAWIVPESEKIARVGLATTKNTHYYFQKFIKQKSKELKLKQIKIQAGVIPIFDPKQGLKKDNCYLLGDASSYVKATTLGGIIPAMQQAQILVDCINNQKDFEKEVKQLRKKMQLHLSLRKILNKFSDADWDYLLDLMQQEKIQKVLEEHTRENPWEILINVILKEPRFIYFVKHLW